MLTSEDIRKLRDKFWQSKDHKWLPPDKLVPTHGDTTAMFTLAGMQQLVPYLMGKPHPLGKRLYNIQKCVRTNDIDEVGDERHLTFFEMMGNWSLGDYFKKEAISWSKEFLTDYLGIDINKLGATVFKGEDGIPKDEESKKIWQEQGISTDRIKELGKEDNFWGPAGEVGPCGPCTEIYFDRGDLRGPADWNLGENDRYLEIRNDVFMEFYKDKYGNYKKLQQQNVDTGMGLERITMVMQGVPTVFETDLFVPILQIIEKYVGKDYPLKKLFYNNIQNLSDKEIKNILSQISSKLTSSEASSEISFSEFLSSSLQTSTILKRFRIIADHIRSSVFLIGDGVIPSNEGRGYVLRRLIRRLYYNLILLNPEINLQTVEKFINHIVEVIADKYGPWRPEVKDEKENIKKVLFEEIKKFDKTIRKGLRLLEEVLNKEVGNVIISSDLEPRKITQLLKQFFNKYIDLPNQEEVFQYIDWILRELIDNAIQHGQTDKIRWGIGIEDGNLILVVYDEGLTIKQRFEKDGIKIDEKELMTKIFERGFTSNPDRGAGNGLYWTNQIVKAVNGKLLLASGSYLIDNDQIKDNDLINKQKGVYIEVRLPINKLQMLPENLRKQGFDLTDNLDLFE